MAEPLDLVAAEYVLGTLTPTERTAFVARLASDREAVTAVRDWAERLAPLAEGSEDIAPPASLWPRVEAALAPANDRGVARGWRTAAVAASLIALLAGGLALRPAVEPRQGAAIAALSASGTVPALLVTWHPATRRYEVQPVAMPAPGGRAHQLWVIADGTPRSLGLLAGQGWIKAAGDPGSDATIAVSLEPAGGSPTGLPTGPVVLSGKLVRMPSAT